MITPAITETMPRWSLVSLFNWLNIESPLFFDILLLKK
jgi:hypothetical protein